MKIGFNDIPEDSSNNVGIFGLKDKETAIVRFLIDSVDDFDIYIDHNNIEYGDKKFQRVNCLRHPSDPVDNCPLCKAGYPLEQVAYFKIIQYVKDSSGNIVATPKIWNRSAKSQFVKDLVQYLQTYGSLSNMICSVTRSGSGFNDTKYTICPSLPEQMYPSNVYIKDASGFENYSILGGLIRDWTADQMNEYLSTGNVTNNSANKNINEPRTVDNSMISNYNKISTEPPVVNRAIDNSFSEGMLERPRRIY